MTDKHKEIERKFLLRVWFGSVDKRYKNKALAMDPQAIEAG